MDIYDREKIRCNLLVETYRLTDGNDRQPIDFEDLGIQLQLDYNEVEKAYYYLKDEGFIESYGSGYIATLSHYGTKMVESFLRKIDFGSNEEFNPTELYQLKILLGEIKEQISTLRLGQEVIFDQIDEAFDQSKIKSKQDWKEYFEGQINDWMSQKIIDYSALLIMQSLLIGLKVNAI
jgi:hypothetical protein